MNELNDAIYNKLAANAPILAAVGTRIYRGVAPTGAVYPLITYQVNGGGELTETPADSMEIYYLVQALSRVSSAEAGSLAELIRTALHKQTLTISGWVNIWTSAGQHFDPVELDQGGVPTWYAGRQVRIRLSK